VYRAQRPGVVLLAALSADGVLRPVGSLLRIAGFPELADPCDARAQATVREALQ